MNIRDLKRRYYLLRLREARGLLLTGAILAVALALFLALAVSRPGGGDPFGHPFSQDPGTICSTHGEGAVVCTPAPEGVKRYRERLRAEKGGKAE